MREDGFTLIEILIVIMLVGIIAVVAFPNFFDLRTDAKDAATKGDLGGMRSAISIITGVIALRESTLNNPSIYPTVAEFSANSMSAAAPGNHVALAGKAIMDKSAGIPPNPWTNTATIHDCTGKAKGALLVAPNADNGWCYDPVNGVIWANSDLSNGGTTENNF